MPSDDHTHVISLAKQEDISYYITFKIGKHEHKSVSANIGHLAKFSPGSIIMKLDSAQGGILKF